MQFRSTAGWIFAGNTGELMVRDARFKVQGSELFEANPKPKTFYPLTFILNLFSKLTTLLIALTASQSRP